MNTKRRVILIASVLALILSFLVWKVTLPLSNISFSLRVVCIMVIYFGNQIFLYILINDLANPKKREPAFW